MIKLTLLELFYDKNVPHVLRKPKELCQVDVLQLFELSGWIFDWGG